MRSGGEADKLANSYEGLWTTYQLFEVVRGEALSLTPEPFEDGIGVEFHKMLPGGIRESHSVKIQTSGSAWTLRALTRTKPNGRSFLGDLIAKTESSPSHRACFVSQVSANPLHILCEDARHAPDYTTFRRRLDVANARVRDDFQSVVVPLCDGKEPTAWDQLRRIEVNSPTSAQLKKAVEREIAREFYRLDGEPLDIASVRRLLAEFILDSLGQEIHRQKILDRLLAEQVGQRDWALDPTIRGRVNQRNNTYLGHVREQLINGVAIPRREAVEAFRRITEQKDKFGLFVGVAGLGKSCVTAELLEKLISAGIPCFALRMDIQTDELTARGLGRKLSLPTSPVDVLNGMADGSLSVLVIDQLDALSLASGRNQNIWEVFEDLLEEIRTCKNLKVWLACRDFDLEHDYRLRNLAQHEKAHQIRIAPLDLEQVKIEIKKANVDPTTLEPKQLAMLQTPMHLSLYLESEPAGKPPFQSVQELYDRYWERKQDLVAERLGRPPHWNQVVDLLCDELTGGFGASVDTIEDVYREDVRFMASANVIIEENSSYRFFHEGFFDYAFARRFVSRGRDLLNDLVLAGDQGLSVRGPVHQVLAYLRGKKRNEYLIKLDELLTDPRVRAHIQRLILDWMSSLPDPTLDEAQILKIDVT
jgi:hypothetical protein